MTWDPKVRKRKPRLFFQNPLSLVFVRPTLNKIQPFQNSKLSWEMHRHLDSIHLLESFQVLNGCILFISWCKDSYPALTQQTRSTRHVWQDKVQNSWSFGCVSKGGIRQAMMCGQPLFFRAIPALHQLYVLFTWKMLKKSSCSAVYIYWAFLERFERHQTNWWHITPDLTTATSLESLVNSFATLIVMVGSWLFDCHLLQWHCCSDDVYQTNYF